MKNEIIANRINQLNQASIISIDAETNGLWGQPFSVAAVAYDKDGNEMSRFVGRCPIFEDINPWVAENVLPKMDEIAETHKDYDSMLKDFFSFAQKYYKNNFLTLCHMGHIVEARLLKDVHTAGIIGDWDAPYEWLDICAFFGDSVDSYNRQHGIELPECEGGTHNPVYDCISAYKAFKHFVG